jgi:diadenylate cyclase
MFKGLVDILLVSFIIYNLFLLIRGTRAVQMAFGIVLIILAYYLSETFELHTVHWLLRNFLSYIVIAIIVLFQAEIRRGLATFGTNPFLNFFYKQEKNPAIEEIVMASTTLSQKRIGGLIVIENEVGLKTYIEGGILLDAVVTFDLLLSIFYPKSPLHDGAVIIKNGRIMAASCFLPLTTNPRLSKDLGTRHRAALGISEESDAVVIVISEETGLISLVYRGKIHRNLQTTSLRNHLYLIIEKKRPEKSKEKLKQLIKQK